MKYPSYLNLTAKDFEDRIEEALKLLNPCQVCPRKCGVNRIKDERGYCFVGRKAVVFNSRVDLGMEESFVKEDGSGAINFNFCNLSCVFCRSYEISQLERGRRVPGKEVSSKKLARIMIDLQKKGCDNIDLVNPTSQVPQILEALPLAIKQGLKIPLIYNTNAYDSVKTLKLLDGIIDIYLPDFKYSSNQFAEKYSQAPEYFNIAKKSIKEMYQQVGNLSFNEKGLIKKGVLVRHLILPNNIAGSERVLKFLAKRISPKITVNIMRSYNPCWRASEYSEINRVINEEEYKEVVGLANKYGLNWVTE